ncbi:hypothetical protein LSTR_LSTR003789 [Laodelphax striatellus]|uniref:Uncharacterized protein n=1 Tax=Laodelphax striatellus TaxID=195883 RepID=A0A482XF90_LAOST|nr:hypothetical protein LSTR_LSTR015929 [Laodelphax striatellus]RZF44149.1 hypothetical protein LSTR_LSTR003789 [Laodelphax striatellus]
MLKAGYAREKVMLKWSRRVNICRLERSIFAVRQPAKSAYSHGTCLYHWRSASPCNRLISTPLLPSHSVTYHFCMRHTLSSASWAGSWRD